MSKEMEIKQECCNIWNNLKDKTSMIDCLIESKQQIADLEAKLAEKERDFDLLMLSKNEEINEWIAVRDDKNKVIDRQTDKIQELKKRLAEKDKEIEKLQHYNDRLAQGIYHSYGEHFISKVKQDKISFAVEKLEKVKEKALHFYVNDTPKLTGFYIDVNEIDNQIKQLKEMK